MSHKATLWAIEQRGLKPTTKIVLWHLCDRFNPDFGCFPSQARLAFDCEISRSTLNHHLDRLEGARLLRRVPRIDPVTKRQMPTRYILGFEEGFDPQDPGPCPEAQAEGFAHDHADTGDGDAFPPEPCPDSGHGNAARAVSGFCADPCPENDQSRVRIPDTNLVREPLREPVKEEEDAQAREADFDQFFTELLGALGLDPANLTAWWQGWPARQHVRRWCDDLGLTRDRIIDVATATRRDHPAPPDGPKALDRAMERAARQEAEAQHPSRGAASVGSSFGCATGSGGTGSGGARQRSQATGTRPSEDEMAAFYARIVNGDSYLPPSMISNAMRNAMLARGLVTPERLRQRGVS